MDHGDATFVGYRGDQRLNNNKEAADDEAEGFPLISGPNQGKMAVDEKEASCRTKLGIVLRENAFIFATLASIVVGFFLGLGLREFDPSTDALMWLGMPGELFFRVLKAVIVPLLVCMMITVTAGLDPRSNGKIAVVGTISFVVSGFVAVCLGIVMFFIFSPDEGSLSGTSDREISNNLETQDVFADLLRNLLPDNIVKATFQQTTTEYKEVTRLSKNKTDNSTTEVTVLVRSEAAAGGINILGLITICVTVGIAANRALPDSSVFLKFFKDGQEVMFVIMRWVFWGAPVGIASMVAQSVASVDDLSAVFYSLGKLVAAVILGLSIHLLILLPAALFFFTRRNPYKFIARCLRVFFISFAATSTSVALPEMLSACDRNQVDPTTASFVIPMSVTLHADGSGLFMIVASLFIAQSSGQGIAPSAYFSMGFLATLLSSAIPPVPSSSIVNIIIILSSTNYPLRDVALLFAVEWILDRCRSGVNGVSHVICAAITAAFCKAGPEQDPGGRSEEFPSIEIDDVNKSGKPEATFAAGVPGQEVVIRPNGSSGAGLDNDVTDLRTKPRPNSLETTQM